MPRYDYRCATCEDVYELSRPMAEADRSATCPRGHVGARRLLAVFATTGRGDGGPDGGWAEPGLCGAPVAGGCGGGCACHPG